ncbi:hypothetical protein C8F04DRAFT_1002731 [Mycena alexandri]|uniref:Zn(2)-C6 fungal-type domain-containing protein n=1 Tax=Mycena alexandri TaxID=1745969 RepID=A0AAD6STS2_9AGAR|nr:hypothetical protein C8F04DRAFT_1002731 [Mycena alexandri]
MAESPDDTGSNGDISDDGRPIPSTGNNSPATADFAWTSRRGKARCDSCRLRNLKCDRILPTCNQCRSTPVTACTYTPLPTPAHRGVPRCDRCRESNLKCDRAAPVCQYCRDGNITDCRYTPKKRARPPTENQPLPTSRLPYNAQAQTASFMFTHMSGPTETNPYATPFVNEPLSSSSRSDAGHSRAEVDRSKPSHPRRGSFSEGPPLALLPAPVPSSAHPHQQPFISHSFAEPNIQPPWVKPWSHPSFHPLPYLVLQRLSGIKSEEMPPREGFDRALEDFLSKLMPDLRETACLPPEAYATLANCLSKSNITRLSPRIRAWATCHRLCSGSDKLNLIVAPRDDFFHSSSEEQHRLVKEYRTSLDRPPQSPNQTSDKDNVDAQSMFERVPVQQQVYDYLAYAHRGHASSIAVMMELRRLNITSITWPMAEIFISLCPICKIINKGGSSLATKGPSANTSAVSR